MISLLFSKISEAVNNFSSQINNITKEIKHVVVIPWTFATENNKEETIQDFMNIGGRHYEKYLTQLKLLQINYKTIKFINPYLHNKKQIKKILSHSDAIFIPGGNPEMFLTLSIRKSILDLLSNYKKIVIGESAGSVLQFELYPLASIDNYYKVPSFYNGLGIIKNNFSINVHTRKETSSQELQNLSNLKNINILAMSDFSCIIYNRQTNKFQLCGNVTYFYPDTVK